MSFDLFPGSGGSAERGVKGAPLAERMRPRVLAEVRGQEHLTAPDCLLGQIEQGATLPSILFWGPPGSGKTTLARILARTREAEFIATSAVSAGVQQIRQAVRRAQSCRAAGRRTILFLDEIHRFNKAQQDALLPHVESGLLILMGATTENPSFEVNSALLSRCRVVVLNPLSEAALSDLLESAMEDAERGVGALSPTLAPHVREALLRGADGDARRLLNSLEVAVDLARVEEGDSCVVSLDHARQALQTAALRYDREGEEHYNLISALHKSIRASDAQGAVYWTERMLEAGEDPLYVARRLARMAVEDVGLADPSALPQAMAAKQAVHFLGLPEGGAALVQAAVYLALAPKSNRVYLAQGQAQSEIQSTGSLPVPLRFRNPVTPLMSEVGCGQGYRYDHEEDDAVSGQSGLPEELEGRVFYRPSDRGFERELKRRLKAVESKRRQLHEGERTKDRSCPEE
jgi:putative ATPase